MSENPLTLDNKTFFLSENLSNNVANVANVAKPEDGDFLGPDLGDAIIANDEAMQNALAAIDKALVECAGNPGALAGDARL